MLVREVVAGPSTMNRSHDIKDATFIWLNIDLNT